MDPIIEMFDSINDINKHIKNLIDTYPLEDGYIIDVEIMPMLSKENRINLSQAKGVDIRYAYKYLVTFYISQEEL